MLPFGISCIFTEYSENSSLALKAGEEGEEEEVSSEFHLDDSFFFSLKTWWAYPSHDPLARESARNAIVSTPPASPSFEGPGNPAASSFFFCLEEFQHSEEIEQEYFLCCVQYREARGVGVGEKAS